MKQTLRITKFVGRSENAVRIQIAVALIAYLLMCALQQITKTFLASSSSFDSCAPISCIEKIPHDSANRRPPRRSNSNNSNSAWAQLEPDSRGLDPAIPAMRRACPAAGSTS